MPIEQGETEWSSLLQPWRWSRCPARRSALRRATATPIKSWQTAAFALPDGPEGSILAQPRRAGKSPRPSSSRWEAAFMSLPDPPRYTGIRRMRPRATTRFLAPSTRPKPPRTRKATGWSSPAATSRHRTRATRISSFGRTESSSSTTVQTIRRSTRSSTGPRTRRSRQSTSLAKPRTSWPST